MNLLRDLEQLKLLRFRKDPQGKSPNEVKKKVTFDAVTLDTTNFEFDREKANER